MERILLSEDKTGFEQYMRRIDKLIKASYDVKAQYELLNIGQFDQETYERLLKEGTRHIRAKLEKNVVDKLNNIGLTQAVFHVPVIKETGEAVVPLDSALKAMHAVNSDAFNRPYEIEIDLECLTIDGDSIKLSGEAIEGVKDAHFRLYLTNETERDLYQLLADISDKVNQLEPFFKGTQISLFQPGGISVLQGYRLITFNDSSKKFEPSGTGVKHIAALPGAIRKMNTTREERERDAHNERLQAERKIYHGMTKAEYDALPWPSYVAPGDHDRVFKEVMEKKAKMDAANVTEKTLNTKTTGAIADIL